jgi:DNA-binding transcriptional ArsR family regulator
MAASMQVIERMADASGVLPSTLDRTLRPLREANLVPMGEKGRGKSRGQYEPHHLVNVILGLAGYQPSDAETAVRLLRRDTFAQSGSEALIEDHFRDWIHRIAPPPQREDWDGTEEGEAKISGGAWLDTLVERLAVMPAQERGEFARICTAQEAEIALCVEWPSIVVSWRGEDGRREEFRFEVEQEPLSDLFRSNGIKAPRRRLTVFPLTILIVAAELAADTLDYPTKGLSFPPSGSTPESESAPDPARSEAPTRTNQPREHRATGYLTDRQNKRVCLNYQGHHGSRGPLNPLGEPHSYETGP